jgi:hypothetical protein
LSTPDRKYPSDNPHLAASIAVQSLELIFGAVRLTALVVFRLAEPLVRIALTALGLLSILMALFYRLASSPPRSPFWLLLGFGILCGLARLAYEHLLHFLSKGLAASRR